MAQEKKGFTHIVVNDGDDDIVIQAGSSKASSSDTSPRVPERSADERSIGADSPKASSADVPRSEKAKAAANASGKPARRAKDEGYRETTLEDLSDSTMSTTQKIIIALCLVGVVAAVVYCVGFMG